MVYRQHPIEYGALTQLWAGTMPEALEHNCEVRAILSSLKSLMYNEIWLSQYVVPWARIAADRARAEAYDDDMCARLWNWLEKEIEGK